MSVPSVLGLPLEEALQRLEAVGIHPSVEETRAPRRPEGVGVFRVVRVSHDSQKLTVCGFMTDLKEPGNDC